MKYSKWHVLSVCVLLVSVLAACNTNSYKLRDTNAHYLLIDSSVGYSPSVENYIQPYRDSLQMAMQKVIGYAEQELYGGLPEGLLTNFVTDLVLEECNVVADDHLIDVSVINIKGLRVPISKGDIRVENIYQLMPFENEVVLLTLSRQQMVELFDFIAGCGGEGMAGASFGIKDKKAMNIRVAGRPLEDRNYRVATSDYLADGGDHFEVFTKALAREGSGLKIRDLIIDHIKKLSSQGQSVNSELDKRIYYAE
ncbi:MULTISPECIES: 5'-nucleotidase C-terminal domain-containing protein [unclassified Carboxylicivirga]|uniref:5'-nucleotidase C-terminal domain-containing protein n=1 Tax=Carboxylicivirga TaxID=1628153 RepID=UPI003D349C4A